MASTLTLNVTETVQQLDELIRNDSRNKKKLSMLLMIKKDPSKGKEKLAFELGVSVRTVQKWRQLYIDGGMPKLLAENRGKTGSIPNELLSPLESFIHNIPYEEEYRRREKVERWLLNNHSIEMNQDALRKYLHRHFGKSQKRDK